jgi:hypothetical protein
MNVIRWLVPALFFGSLWVVDWSIGGEFRDPRGPQSQAEGERSAAAPLRSADSDSPLPEGWPDATLPGRIEVKDYPAYRSAEAQAKGASLRSDGILFFSLFNHISQSKIEMTAPVVNTYLTPEMIETPRATGDMTMEFLYRSLNQGEVGKGVGAVKVKDHPAQTFVCLGLVGEMDPQVMREGVRKLREWLQEHKAEWVEAGPVRRLGYHGPMTPSSQRRWEIQIPIRPMKPQDSGTSTTP